MNLARIALCGTLWLTAGQYLASAVAIASNLYLARLLGPAAFGTFFVVSSTVDVLFLVATSFSFGQYLVQASTITVKACRAVMACTAGVSALATLVAGAGAWAVRSRYPSTTIALFVALLIVRAIWNVSLVAAPMLERALAYRALVAFRLATAAGGGLCAIAAALAGGGVASLLAREIGMVVVGSMVMWTAVARVVVFSDDAESGAAVPEVWRFGFRLSGVQMLEMVFHRADGLLLGWLLGLEHRAELGYYAQAKYVANIPSAAADTGTRAVAYRMYAIVRDDAARLRAAVEAAQFWTLRLVLPIALVFVAIPAGICRWLLGPAWEPAAPILQALALFGPFLILFNNLKMLRLVLHDWRGLYRAYLVQLAMLGGGLVLGVSRWGVVGGATSVTLACGAGYLAMAWRGRVIPETLIGRRLIGLPCVAIAAVAAVTLLQPSIWNRNAALGVVYVLGLYAVLLTTFDGAVLRRSFREAAVLIWA